MYWHNGKLKESGSFQKDEKIGKWSTYSEYGRLLSTGKYQVNKKTGKWIFYDEKGCKLRQQSYSEDIPNGKWVAYQANGKKQDAGCYKMLDKTGYTQSEIQQRARSESDSRQQIISTCPSTKNKIYPYPK